MKIGVVFGNPETTTGGNALKFYSSVRCEIRRAGNLKEGEAVIGTRAKVKVVKNKVRPALPGGGVRHRLQPAASAARARCWTWASTLGLVEKSGSFFSLRRRAPGQGRERAIEWLKANPSSSKQWPDESSLLGP